MKTYTWKFIIKSLTTTGNTNMGHNRGIKEQSMVCHYIEYYEGIYENSSNFIM